VGVAGSVARRFERSRARVAGLVVVLGCLPSCTNVTRLGVGPVAAYPGGQGASYGDAFVLRRGVGTSDFEGISIGEYEARAVVTEDTQAASLGAGYSAMRWLGSGMLGLSVTPALGIERCRGKMLGNAGLHGGFFTGITLAEVATQRRVPYRESRHAGLGVPEYVIRERERTVLTLEFMGSVDARGTREPLLMSGLLVGLAWTNESHEVVVEPLDESPFGFGPFR